jgi:hypothetical protein
MSKKSTLTRLSMLMLGMSAFTVASGCETQSTAECYPVLALLLSEPEPSPANKRLLLLIGNGYYVPDWGQKNLANKTTYGSLLTLPLERRV